MINTKKILCYFSFYDQLKIQKKMEDMARQGWMVYKPGNIISTFQRMEPKNLRFCVTCFPNASDFDPNPTETELTRLDFCAQDGWRLAAKWGVMQIFYHENEHAVPIETEPVAQVENVTRAMRKNVLLPHLLTTTMVVWYLFLQVWLFRTDMVEYLSNPFQVYQIPIWICLLLACLYEIGFYFHWTRKARRMAVEHGLFLPIQTKMKFSYFLLAGSVLLSLLAFGSSRKHLLFGLIWCAVIFCIFFSANRIREWMKKKGMSRQVNVAVSIGSTVLLTILFMGIAAVVIIRGSIRERKPVGSYVYHGTTWDIYDEPLPLEIADLMEMEGNWSKEVRHQETILLSRTQYEQRALLTEPKGVENLSYTVMDIKLPFLRDWIRQMARNARQDEVHGDFVFTDHFEPMDASVWQAEEAYQLHWSDTVLNTYLLFWGNRMVEITFYWEPTEEQITTAAEILQQMVSPVHGLP